MKKKRDYRAQMLRGIRSRIISRQQVRLHQLQNNRTRKYAGVEYTAMYM